MLRPPHQRIASSVSARPQSGRTKARMVLEKSQGMREMAEKSQEFGGPTSAQVRGIQSGMRISIIEDDDRVARGLMNVLAQAGFEVNRIATATEAVRADPA